MNTYFLQVRADAELVGVGVGVASAEYENCETESNKKVVTIEPTFLLINLFMEFTYPCFLHESTKEI
jgi:hypothetical protein